MKINKSHRSFGGTLEYCEFESNTCQSTMRFSIFTPSSINDRKAPVLFWLSGLTCTEDNFMAKAGAQRVAEELGLAIVAPDTSPRGLGLPGEDDSYDFGSGAGFYVDATREPWSKNYQMASFVTSELPELIENNWNIDGERRSISGHSMGGHGALTIGLKNTDRYRSISAFSPICAPTQCPWGKKAFEGYLGEPTSRWNQYDASYLIENWSGSTSNRPPIWIDQGLDDEFLKEQLRPEIFEASAKKSGYPIQLRQHAGYDHSYFFIASFIEEHLRFHSECLR